jgi:hypothetical protein
MATASLAHELSTSTLPVPAATPRWWRRGHSYAFVAVATVELGLTWGVVRWAEQVAMGPTPLQSLIMAAMIGFLLAQCFLLGLWAALGGLPTIARWLIVGLVSTVGSLAVADVFVSSEWGQLLDQGPIFVLLAGLMLAAFAGALLPLRRLVGWRVDFDSAYHAARGPRRGQLEMMDFAAMFCAVALPLTLCRALMELMGEEAAGVGLIVLIIGAVVLATAGPVAYALLNRRRPVLTLLVCGAWLVLVCGMQTALAARFPDLDVFGGRGSLLSIAGTVVAFDAAVAAAVALPLCVLRLVGLKLITVA